MSITIEELKQTDKESYQLIDIRSEYEIAHGCVPGAIAISAEELIEFADSRIDKSKTIVVCCSRGRESIDVAERLKENGIDAKSLEGGYVAWLLDYMKSEDEADTEKNFARDVEQSLRKKFKKSIFTKFAKGICTYEHVTPGDKIAVCISGGKDSMLMAKCFQELKRHNKFEFEVKYLVMDPGYSPENRRVIEENARRLDIPITIYESDIFDAVYDIEKSPCYLCARMRRGHLYSYAKELGCNKIALGHHYDDVIETTLMNMLNAGSFQTMLPKVHSDNYKGMELIRPMYYIREKDILLFCEKMNLSFIRCACKFTEKTTTGEIKSQRKETKLLIAKLKKEMNEHVEENIFSAANNVVFEKILGYKDDQGHHSFLEIYDKEGK